MDVCETVFGVIVGSEGGYSVTRSDHGDWTSGICGSGECLGTNYGVDTATYAANVAQLPAAIRATMPPTVRDLTLTQAAQIFRLLYWNPCRCDDMPPPLALLVADSAFNNGPARSARFLQAAVGVAQDGQIGPVTLAAVARAYGGGGAALCSEVLARRIVFMAGLPTWGTFGLGWSRRLAALPFHCVALAESTAAEAPDAPAG